MELDLFCPASIEYAHRLNFTATNNEAEYEALVDGLNLAKALRAKNLLVYSDSQLDVMETTREYKLESQKCFNIWK